MITSGADGIQEEPNDQIFHVSQDGVLALTVTVDIDEEQLLGFHGFDWKLQVSSLSEQMGMPPESALATYISQILNDQAIIALLTRAGEIVDIWITEDPQSDLEFQKDGETLTFRYWSGEAV